MDEKTLGTYAKRVFGSLGGAMTSAMIWLGDELGLYRTLVDTGPVTSEELAAKTGLSERWVREWLHQQGAAEILEYHGEGRFGLSEEGAAVLANESHPAFGAGFFQQLPQLVGVLERVGESFRTGLGLPYDALGPEGARGIERGCAPWFRALLVPMVLPRVDGVVATLERGVRAADVGCGSGAALLQMAKAFPKSEFHGYDISQHALERAERNRADADIANAHFHDATVDPLPEDESLAFVTTIDCLHDMTDPAGVMAGIRKALSADGAWLIADIKAHDTYEENVERNPMAPMMYGTSVLACMSSSLSEPGGAGLGTLGFSENRARHMLAEAGFSHFERLDVDHPVNAFYVVRP
jgi:2-polyprenyl-3-methyl-5-hydroxy-6-metoxy-1,4-benzoquinol methylase